MPPIEAPKRFDPKAILLEEVSLKDRIKIIPAKKTGMFKKMPEIISFKG